MAQLPPNSPLPQSAQGGIDKWLAYGMEALLLLRRYWWILAGTVALGVFVQIIVFLFKPVEYASSARFVVSGKLALPQDLSYNEEAQNFFGTQVEMIKSPEVRQRAYELVKARQPSLAPIPVSLDATQVPKTSVIVINATGAEPHFLQQFLQCAMEAYVIERKSMFDKKSDRAISVITDEINRHEEDLKQSESSLFEWQRQNNLVSLREEDNSAANYLTLLNRRLAGLQTEYRLLQTLTLDQNLDRASTGMADATVVTDGDEPKSDSSTSTNEYLKARETLTLLQAQLARILEVLKSDHPKALALKEQIALQEKLIEILRQNSANQLTNRRDALNVQIENTKSEITGWQQKALDVSQRLGEADRLKAKVDRQKELYAHLLASLQSVDIGSSIQQDIVSILDNASPATIVRVNLAVLLLKGAFLGFLLGAAILLILRGVDDRVTSATRLTDNLPFPIASIIPTADMAPGWLLDGDARSTLRESFRNLRSWLQFQSSEENPARCLLITSAVPNEGKSTVASNLATVLSWSESRVLLIDADFRCGRLHEGPGVSPSRGLAEILQGKAKADAKTILCLAKDQLYFLPRGEAFRHGMDGINRKSIETLLVSLRQRYDWIIIDASPLLAADDACNFAPLVDGCLVVVRSGISSFRLVRHAFQLLESRHAPIAGIVYNGCSDRLDYPYYRYAEYHTPATS